MDTTTIAQFALATLLPVAACIALWLLRTRTRVANVPERGWQAIVGVVFGLIAIYGTEAGIPVNGAMMNVRDAAPLAAGLFFGGPAGIIAGLIGGAERWLAVYWGVGAFTRVACTLGTMFAGVFAAALRKYVFTYHIPNLSFAFASGIVTEVLHLLLVFITNLDQSARAFAVVQACVLPMTLCVGLSAMLCSLSMLLLNRKPLVTPVGERNVVRILHNRMLIAIVAAFFLTTGFTAIVQTSRSEADTADLLALSIQDVRNEVDAAPGTGTETGEAADDRGGQGEPHDPNASGASGTPSASAPGAPSASASVPSVPSAASDDLSLQIEDAVRNRRVGQTGELVAVDASGTVVGTRDGTSAESGTQLLADSESAGAGTLFTTMFADEECYALYQEVQGYRIIALLPTAEANASRDAALLITALMEVLVFAALFLVIHAVAKLVVIRGVRRMTDQLHQITAGDLNVEVDVRDAKEFASLSRDINLTVEALKTSLATVQADLDKAAEVQKNILPTITRVISDRSEFELSSSMEPAKEVGGDFYDFFMIDGDHLALVVADVSGKGIPAALFMMLSKTVLKMEALSNTDPAAVLLRVNADLSEKNDDFMFTTAWLGVLEISTGTLTYADAGHEKLAIFRNGAWELPRKQNGAVALAVFAPSDYDGLPEKFHFRNHTLKLEPGDAVFQYTDGVTEATDADDELFGEERLLEALGAAPSASPGQVLPFVRERIAAFTAEAPQFDDITMLGLLYKGAE